MRIINAHISLFFHVLGGVRRGAKESVVSQLTPHPVLSMPPGTPQGACRRPPGSPPRRPEKAHIKHVLFTPPPGGPPEDALEAPGKQPHTTPHIYCTLENIGQEP